MKTLKQIIILAAAVCAVNAHASYSLTVNTDHDTVPTAIIDGPGQSATFHFTVNASPGSQNSYYNSSASSFELFYSATGTGFTSSTFITSPVITGLPSGQLFNQTPYNFTVSWTPANSRALGFYKIRVLLYGDASLNDNGRDASGSTSAYLHLVNVPEPTQVIGASMLLACGGLVFIRRQYIKKQLK
ncbi:MAG: hypothetical protein WCH99_05620 [Verrucomicrobiota bacterium]